ncbi:hypothetical protein BAG01nite_12940 [Brevibacillus agri]|uniref:Uncharacterized protein n=1 Tax=Brevibacillus agri TaxID=51101 RepID=A0A3M8ASF7_9BACL|nr:hypothetical protein [Brevibacillus agri]MDN4094169.1 hypothetical protein [Brevibacillus agri]QAV13230.1 hypothetical protein BA6348_10995 [Brevibacillus agri]RNB54130.1 hypothetical protein EB820_14550 [Brevibacillus agri]GED25192.1 hypothetical protein BAG01nite_12940 [Brevibacillus agri]
MQKTETKKAYICYCPSLEDWFVTIDEEEAKQYEHYLASIDDLKDAVCLGDNPIDGIIKVEEGLCKYVIDYDEDGEIDSAGYQLIQEVAA